MSNIEKIKAEIEKRREDIKAYCLNPNHDKRYDVVPEQLAYILSFIDSLPEEKLSEDFPTSDEEVAKFLATHPKVEVPEKYKTPNWLFDKQPSEDLEEAAEDLFETIEIQEHEYIFEDTFKKIFIAGAEWQKKHDAELIEIAYNDGITIGKTKQKEQMTKDAVEGEIGYWNQTGLSIRLDQSLEKLGYDEDTKVKIIIVKQ